MHILITVLVCFFAGMGAGLGTGFAGMSAAAVISPMLITFLGMDPYLAVGIALSSDVLASAVSAYTYGKNKNLDIRNGLIMMASVLAFTVVGSYIASIVPSATMGSFSVVMTFLLGVKFIVRPVMTTKEAMQSVSAKKRAVQSVVCGVIVGFICGFVGAGGGMMMLLILTSVLGYELKTAVGTSVFIMAFTALTGAVSHFAIGGAPDWTVFALCVVFTLLWARIAAVFANKAEPKTLNRATGVVLVVLGAVVLSRGTAALFLTVGFPLAFSSGGKPEAFVLFRFSLLFSGRSHCLFQTLRCIMSRMFYGYPDGPAGGYYGTKKAADRRRFGDEPGHSGQYAGAGFRNHGGLRRQGGSRRIADLSQGPVGSAAGRRYAGDGRFLGAGGDETAPVAGGCADGDDLRRDGQQLHRAGL